MDEIVEGIFETLRELEDNLYQMAEDDYFGEAAHMEEAASTLAAIPRSKDSAILESLNAVALPGIGITDSETADLAATQLRNVAAFLRSIVASREELSLIAEQCDSAADDIKLIEFPN